MHRKQFALFAVLIGLYALIAFVSYAFFFEQMTQGAPVPVAAPEIPTWILGLANAGIILVFYGLLGLAGYWFARRLGLPGITNDSGGWRSWFWMPLIYGIVLGVFLALVDLVVSLTGLGSRFPHPAFPFSILASFSAGIGEEILFRGFVFGLWAFLLNLVLKRWNKTGLALWIANIIAAFAFSAGHLPAAMLFMKAPTPFDLPSIVIAEIFLLNGVVGLAAGQRYMKNGLIAAIGVHFWTDIVWHVIYALIPI